MFSLFSHNQEKTDPNYIIMVAYTRLFKGTVAEEIH